MENLFLRLIYGYSFRKWFEKEILENNLFVINATEGGAKNC